VGWDAGRAVALNGAKGHEPLSVAEIAAKMSKTGGPIVGRASLYAPAAGPGFAAHICDLEVDKETGCSKVVRYTAIQDVGTAVHPSYVEGQMQGGVAQGIGWALNEEYIYDAEGIMQNAGFLDYRIPVASDLPAIETVLIEVPNPLHPYGVRGVGEVPIVPPLAAVANAMRDATGVRFTELPMSPPRVLDGLSKPSP
jgi:CO/xanthine dehydrogenase Mo-binding subunit